MIEPQKWASTLGSQSETVTLPDEDLQFASFKKLFPALTQVPLSEGGVAPQRTDFNTLFKLLGDNIFYIQQGGVFSYSATADYERGAFVKYNNKLYLCIKDNSSFNKHAPTDAEYWLKVALNNDLANYLPLAGGLMTGPIRYNGSNMYFHLRGGEDEGSAYLNLYNNLNGGNGQFSLSAKDSTTVYSLSGTPDGLLTWGGQNVVRTINNVTADSAGNVSLIDSGADYIRLGDGTQICHGQISSSAADTDIAVTFPKPFNAIYYNVTFGDINAVSSNIYLSLPNYVRTSTSVMTVRFNGIGSISWIAVGRWK